MSVNIKRNGTLQKVAAQTILFDADCAEIRTGTYSIECMSDSGANATITFSTPMPDNDYIVIFKQESPAAGEIGFRTCTTTGFNLFVLGGRYGTAAEAMTFTGTYYAFKLVELEGYSSIYNKILNSIDSSPTQNSTNFVTSGGVYEAIANSASSFIGTQEEWENLSVAQKSQYEIVYITDDEAAVESVVVDQVADGNMSPVTSNAVYDALSNIEHTYPNDWVSCTITNLRTDLVNTTYLTANYSPSRRKVSFGGELRLTGSFMGNMGTSVFKVECSSFPNESRSDVGAYYIELFPDDVNFCTRWSYSKSGGLNYSLNFSKSFTGTSNSMYLGNIILN